jgi:hypothetical protein
MRTSDLIEKFIVGGLEKGNASGGRLYIEDNKIINYGTCLAEIVHGNWYVNITKYSRTTTTHQNKIVRTLKERGQNPILLENVPMGSSSLTSRSYA